MEDFLLLLLEPLFEAILEFLLGVLIGTIIRIFWPDGSDGEPIDFWRAVRGCIGYLLLGALAGRFTLSYFPHPFFHHSPVPGLSVIVSPFFVGLLMSWTGSMLRKQEREPAQIEGFGYGFSFGFGVALLRFLFAR